MELVESMELPNYLLCISRLFDFQEISETIFQHALNIECLVDRQLLRQYSDHRAQNSVRCPTNDEVCGFVAQVCAYGEWHNCH